jgi:hypothetical protein
MTLAGPISIPLSECVVTLGAFNVQVVTPWKPSQVITQSCTGLGFEHLTGDARHI